MLADTFEQSACIIFCVNFGKPVTENFKMLLELLANILYIEHRWLNGLHISRSVECQLKIMSLYSNNSSAKSPKNVKKKKLIAFMNNQSFLLHDWKRYCR